MERNKNVEQKEKKNFRNLYPSMSEEQISQRNPT
jgi:hypothetical protein